MLYPDHEIIEGEGRRLLLAAAGNG